MQKPFETPHRAMPRERGASRFAYALYMLAKQKGRS
jgi:hypothetical protein